MGAEWSSIPHTRPDNLLLPPEVVEKIADKIGVRDRLVFRLACKDWNSFLITSSLLDEVKVQVRDTQSILSTMVNYPLSGCWASYEFHSLDLTRSSTEFWALFGDHITSIDFYECFITPQNSGNEPEFRIGCPNLKHLGLVNCDKYLMMGSAFFQLPSLLSLENVESLNLENNKYLNDAILFALLTRIKALKSLNLSNCTISFMNAVFTRFYPGIDAAIVPKMSDNVLCFQALYRFFLATAAASHMTELILNRTRVDGAAFRLLADPAHFHWQSICIDGCTEIKPANLVEFMDRQRFIKKLDAGIIKVSADELNTMDLTHMEHLSLQNEKIDTLDFFERIPGLKFLNIGISSCPRLWENIHGLRHAVHLQVLKLTSVSTLQEANRAITETLCQIIPTSFTNLRELSLEFRRITTVDLSQEHDRLVQLIIQHLGQLEVLRLRSASVTDLGLAGRYIDEYDPRLPPGAVARLRAVYQEHMQINAVGLSLSNLKHLRVLDLDHCLDLREATWRVALQFPFLERLCLAYCTQISTNGVLAIIGACRNLEEIDLRGCGPHVYNDPEIEAGLRSSLPRMRKIILE